MALPPRDAPNPTGYLVAAPNRRSRAPRALAILAGAVVVVLGAGVFAVALTTGGAATATPSLSPAERVVAEPTPSATPTTAAAAETTATTSSGRTMALALPDTAPIGRVVVFADGGVDAAATVASADAVALTGAGWAVAAYDGAGSDFGSPESQTAVAELLTWSGEQVAAGPLVVATYGAGAATAISGIAAARAEPSCWASVDPLTDLVGAAVADEALQDQIVAAWGRVPAESELPRSRVIDLPTTTVYRVLAPDSAASTTAREDAATLVSALEESGHDVTTVESGAAWADLLTALRGCEA